MIKVSGLPPNQTKDAISMFFRKKKITGLQDAKLKILTYNEQRREALIEFEDNKVVFRLLKKKELEYHGETIKILPHKMSVADEDKGYPSKQLKVMGFNSKTSGETIDMYFDSKKKSGGEAESINFDHFYDEKYVIVLYDDIEDIDRVLSKEHNLEGSKLEVTEFKPEPLNTKTVQVTGFKDTTSFETLELYFESKKKSGAEAEKIKLNEDENCLYVTYSCYEDMETVLQRTHEIQGNKLYLQKLDIKATENLPIIEVTGFKDTTSFETLELYFESKKKSGAEAEMIKLNEDENCLYVTYSCNEECDIILSREHRIENCQLILKKHHTSRKKEKRRFGNGSSFGNNKLQNYIENKNKFGAVVTHSSFKDTENVCWRQQTIERETINDSKWNDRFLIRNISEDTSLQELKDYLKGKLGCDAIKILFSDEEDKAIVYCTSNQYDIIFSKADILILSNEKKLNERILTLSPVYKSKIVQVSGFTPDTDEEDLEYYFENKKKSKGGDVEKVEFRNVKAFALVHFVSYEDACNVCQTDHELLGVNLNVKEYQKCLGVLGGIEDPDSFTQPEPQLISLNDIQEGKLFFIYQTPENQNVFETKMQELDTVVNWWKKKKIVELKLNLPSKVRKGRQLAKKWMKNHQSYFKDYMETILYQEFKLLSEVIELVAIDLIRPEEKDLVVQVSGSSIIVIGSNTEVFQIFINDLNTRISKIEADLERKKKEVMEIVAFKYSYTVLDTFGIIKMIQDSSGKLKICKVNEEVLFQGTISEIKLAKLLIYQKVESIKNKMITDVEMSPMIMELLLRPEVKKHIIDNILKGYKEFAVWEEEVLMGKKTGSLKVVAKDQPSLKKIIDIFSESISQVEHKIDPESSHLLTDKKCMTVLSDMLKQYQRFIKIKLLNKTAISITCMSDIAGCVMQEIKTFFEENTIYTKSCKLPKSHDLFIKKYLSEDLTELAMKLQVKLTMYKETVGLKLEGTNEKVQEVLEALKKICKSIEYRAKNIGERMHNKLLDSEKGSEILNNIEEQLRCVILKEKEEMVESMIEEKELLSTFEINNAIIRVIQADITTIPVDVIVNTANEKLELKGGGVGFAIKKKGGTSIQKECDDYVHLNGSVLEGDCMMSKAGNLPCTKIIHAVGPMWSGGKHKEDEQLDQVINRILEMVMKHGYQSIAIPAISTGINSYPLQAATDIIVQSIARHFKKVARSSITTVYLIDIHDESLHSFIHSLQSSGDFIKVEFDYQPKYGKQTKKLKGLPFFGEVSLSFFSDDPNEIEKAMNKLDRSIKFEIQEFKIPVKDLTLTDEQKRRILLHEILHPVVVKIDEGFSTTIVIRGLMADVNVVNSAINSILFNALKREATGLPTSWTIPADTNLNIVLLNAARAEYKQVESNFLKTLGKQSIPIIKIERIENRSVYGQYMAKKKHMELELKNKSVIVEKPVLWHGTDQQAVDNINNYGFNRSYCGKNAALYGQGVYFAVSSSYSVRYTSGTPGTRQMYQCKVLAGQYTRGDESYRVPPAKPGGGVYESLVDNVSTPSMYVIFHDTQAYPEYLITF